jgi:hypothetical protein
MLNRTERARRATRALNRLIWSENIWAEIKRMFHTAIGSILGYGWKIWTLEYKLKEKLSGRESDFWGRAEKNSRL